MIRVARTDKGWVRGIEAADPRVTAFKGIPFAAPPVGENRWRAPMEAASWEGVRDCSRFAPISVQDVPGIGDNLYNREWHVDPDVPMSEDCLYLNVWTGAKDAGERLPVLVWFFGGGLQWGYPSEMEFDGERLARRSVVVVTVNYRLNVFGFLAHPELSDAQPDAPANFGSLDQQAAIRWVARNIAAFGGDPANVTIAGQSAGGGSVLSQLTCMDNAGLFQKAVVMSAMIRDPYGQSEVGAPTPLQEAEENGRRFFAFLGVSTLAEARALDAKVLSQKYAQYANGNPRMFPVLDGRFCVGDPLLLFREGRHVPAAVLAGNTADEFPNALFAASKEELREKAIALFGARAEEFLAFPEAQFLAPGEGIGKISGIECTVKSVYLRREGQGSAMPMYYYRFDADIPGSDDPGTFHSSDLWFFFETLAKCWRPFVGRHYDLARQMCNYFANFIRTGDPNGVDADGTPLPCWKPYTNHGRNEMIFTGEGAKPGMEAASAFRDFLVDALTRKMDREARLLRKESVAQGIDPTQKEGVHQGDGLSGKASADQGMDLPRKESAHQAFNPYLPSWEYIPDGEPYVFGDRVYVYGSHDHYNGAVFCLGDYVCWSAPVDDLGNWRFEGVIYERNADPLNRDGRMCLFAPDVTVGPDGRYYLYYVLNQVSVVSVAVCDTPAGHYQFYGYVHDANGARLGERPGDEPQFDPGVLTEGEKVYLYTGFCGKGDKGRHGAMATVLAKDMLTIAEEPVFVAPGCEYSAGTDFAEHPFFEAPSIRKRGDTYYFIYSSTWMHELCYATSKHPTKGFSYGGVLVSNCDLHIDTYKPADRPMAYGANNHGSMVQIGEDWYIFYHRHTNGTWYSRQGCAEKLAFLPDGEIRQAEITSCGLNGGPLVAKGETYPAYIACHLFTDTPGMYVGEEGGRPRPKVMQDGRDGDRDLAYVGNLTDTATAGYKSFACENVRGIRLVARGYGAGVFEVRTSWDGEVLGRVAVDYANDWQSYAAPVDIPDGTHALYLTYRGDGNKGLRSFTFL